MPKYLRTTHNFSEAFLWRKVWCRALKIGHGLKIFYEINHRRVTNSQKVLTSKWSCHFRHERWKQRRHERWTQQRHASSSNSPPDVPRAGLPSFPQHSNERARFHKLLSHPGQGNITGSRAPASRNKLPRNSTTCATAATNNSISKCLSSWWGIGAPSTLPYGFCSQPPSILLPICCLETVPNSFQRLLRLPDPVRLSEIPGPANVQPHAVLPSDVQPQPDGKQWNAGTNLILPNNI